MLNALTNQLKSQKINRIEELLLQQQNQLIIYRIKCPLRKGTSEGPKTFVGWTFASLI